jgi:NAD(P)-dependent dehydrogenase (short-subunit alcohol dehydrogenase family)
MQIEGASALVTGAGRGIGRAVSLALARAGARVTGVARSSSELESLAAEVAKAGGSLLPHAGDLCAPETAAAAVAAAQRAHGPLRILVNNAGVTVHKPLAETTDADWDAVIGTNLSAVFRLTRAALPDLARDGGHVFMISSLAGTNAIAGLAAYCASKAALDHLAACLMLEVRQRGVKVTTLAPGSVNTGFGGRSGDSAWMIQPEDVAQTILDLLRMADGTHPSRIEMRPTRPPAK